MSSICSTILCKIQISSYRENSSLWKFTRSWKTRSWIERSTHTSRNCVKKSKTSLVNPNASRLFEEWGINLSPMNKKWRSLMPSGFLSRLTFLNIFIIVIATAVSGWAIYNTACFLVASAGDLDAQRQQQFNRTLFHYLWVFMITAALAGSVLHFYMTKRLIRPIRNLLQSTKELKLGQYPEPIKVNNDDEMGQLVSQYNELISQLKSNEQQRKKLITDLSHEIRTPLSNLSGYLQALKDGDLTGNEKLFSDLYLESNRLSKLVEQLEQLKDWDDLSSQSFVNKDWHEIHDLMRQCVAMFDRTWEQTHYDIQLD